MEAGGERPPRRRGGARRRRAPPPASILLPAGRSRSAAMLVALVLFPVLILGDQWHSHQIVDLRDDTLAASSPSVSLAVAIAAALAFAFQPLADPAAAGDRRRAPVPRAAACRRGHGEPPGAALPGDRRRGPGVCCRGVSAELARGACRGMPAPAATLAGSSVLAAVVVLYALQALYSPDFSKGLQNVCFFFVPFSLVYALLRDVELGPEAAYLGPLGRRGRGGLPSSWSASVEYAEPQPVLERPGDPVERIPHLLPGQLGLLGPERLRALPGAGDRRRDGGAAVGARTASAGVADGTGRDALDRPGADLLPVELRRAAGRPRGARGAALELALDPRRGRRRGRRRGARRAPRRRLGEAQPRPHQHRHQRPRQPRLRRPPTSSPSAPSAGYGSGCFPRPTANTSRPEKAPVSVSHTEPITVAAEQGSSARRLCRAGRRSALDDGRRSRPATASVRAGGAVGGTDRGRLGSRVPARQDPRASVARAAVLAAFVALLVHTMAYAGFFEDPITWVLLAVGRLACAGPGPRRDVGSPRVGIPPPPSDDRRRLHGGEHHLEADRGRAAAALHALPDPGRLRRRRGAVRRGGRRQHRHPPRHDRGAAALLLQGRRGPGRVVATSFAALFWFATIGGADRAALRRSRSPKRCSTDPARRA